MSFAKSFDEVQKGTPRSIAGAKIDSILEGLPLKEKNALECILRMETVGARRVVDIMSEGGFSVSKTTVIDWRNREKVYDKEDTK